ncbi:2050_t:CDS:2 [Entrophospora sp. SA101]|nr:2050_t:CDS:2 [Entrophospora sp. SA101]CAJ0853378.1 13573_t:CDS:2 [Entrophospora sp. SA101]
MKYFSAKYNGQELDPELFLVETDDNEEFDTESSEDLFNYNEWILNLV